MQTIDSKQKSTPKPFLMLSGKKIYHITSALSRLIFSPIHSIRTLLRVLRLDMWIIEGNEISSGQKLSLLYAGHEANKNYITTLAFGNSYHENNCGRKWLWEISKIAQKNSHNCSLIVTEIHKSFQIFFRKIKYLLIPIWISGDIDISHENPSLPKNKGLKADISKIKKNKLLFEVTDKLSDLHNFYYQMHLPFITKVHGNRSVINSYNAMKKEFGKHGPFNNLLLIKKENEYIAGILIGDKNNVAKLGSLGIKDGNLNYTKDRAIGALIYFSIVHCAKKGLTKFEFGKSRPFLNDGILQYKKKWNQQISNQKNLCFLINMLSETEGTKRFLENNPFVYENNSDLYAAVFTEGNRNFCKEDFKKIYKDYFLPGLSKLVIYQFGQEPGKTPNIIPEELAGKITISSAKSIL